MTPFEEKPSAQSTEENVPAGDEKEKTPATVSNPVADTSVVSNNTNANDTYDATNTHEGTPADSSHVSTSNKTDAIQNPEINRTTDSFEGISPEEILPAPSTNSSSTSDDSLNIGATSSATLPKQQKNKKIPTEEIEANAKNFKADADDNDDDTPMTLRGHFRELRKRLCWAFLFAVIGFAICYPFAQEIFQFLVLPLDAALPPGSKFQYTAAHEAFFVFMQVGFVAGIFLMSPFIFYQIWSFIAPGLYKSERVYVVPIAIASAVFFIGGGAFCYFVVFPVAFKFFMQFSHGNIVAMPTLKNSFGFILQMIFAFGLVFELPLFVFFLARIGLVTAGLMRRMRRYAILANVIIAAILTPPEVISQLLMACPMILLYEFSIYIAQIFGRKEKINKDDDEEEDDNEEASKKTKAASSTTSS